MLEIIVMAEQIDRRQGKEDRMKYILVHGLGQTPGDWEKTADALMDKTDVVCPDLTELLKGETSDYAHLYSAFSRFCMTYDEPLVLCGLSLGGVLAMHYAIEHPDQVRAVALIAAPYTMPKRLLQFQNAIFRILPKRAFQGMGFSKQEMIRLSHSMMDLDFRDDLHKIKCPALILCGAKDRANRKAALEMQKWVPHAKIAMIANAGHEVNKDAPAALGQELQRFFQLVFKGE